MRLQRCNRRSLVIVTLLITLFYMLPILYIAATYPLAIPLYLGFLMPFLLLLFGSALFALVFGKFDY